VERGVVAGSAKKWAGAHESNPGPAAIGEVE
jgi:hypothetical protein